MEADDGDKKNIDINSYTHVNEWYISTNFFSDALSLSFNVDNTYMHGRLKADGVDPDYLNPDRKEDLLKYY